MRRTVRGRSVGVGETRGPRVSKLHTHLPFAVETMGRLSASALQLTMEYTIRQSSTAAGGRRCWIMVALERAGRRRWG